MVQGGRGLIKRDFRSEPLDGWMILIFIKIGNTGARRVFLGNVKNSVLSVGTLRYLHDIQVKISSR